MESIELFLKSCRSQETRYTYKISFQKYIDFIGENDLFCQNNARVVEAKIIEFIISLRDEGKSYSAILNYLNAVKAFYKINDLMLNSHKINKFMPEQIKVNRDRAYSHEEISKILNVADERMRVVTLVLASSGIRLGAIPSIKLHNMEDDKLTVYENTR